MEKETPFQKSQKSENSLEISLINDIFQNLQIDLEEKEKHPEKPLNNGFIITDTYPVKEAYKDLVIF